MVRDFDLFNGWKFFFGITDTLGCWEENDKPVWFKVYRPADKAARRPVLGWSMLIGPIAMGVHKLDIEALKRGR